MPIASQAWKSSLHFSSMKSCAMKRVEWIRRSSASSSRDFAISVTCSGLGSRLRRCTSFREQDFRAERELEEHYSLAELKKLAQDRLRPSITNPNYLVLRKRAQLLAQWMDEIPGSNLRVLDIGGRYQPYRPLIDGRVKQYVAVDVVATKLVDVVARGRSLPFPADTFDLVIATQVFEYFPRPHVVCRANPQRVEA